MKRLIFTDPVFEKAFRRIVDDPAQRASALVGLAKVEAARGRPDAAAHKALQA